MQNFKSFLKEGTENSNGKLITSDKNKLREFNQWFKGSKIVDELKRPMIMYHGTKADIKQFSYEFADKGNGQYGMGFYFTNMSHTASGYSANNENDYEGGNVLPVYLSIKKPLLSSKKGHLSKLQIRELLLSNPNFDIGDWQDVDYYGKTRALNMLIDDIFNNSDTLLDELNKLANDFFKDDNEVFLKNVIRILGYDGVIHKFENGEIFVVAWDPNQIRSIYL